MIMKYAISKQNERDVLKFLNHARLFKKAFLPFELVGSSGREETKACANEGEKSQMK